MQKNAIKISELAKTRELTGIVKSFFYIAAIAFSSFHLYTLGLVPLMAMKMRTIHITGIVAMIFLLYPATKKSSRKYVSILDWILFCLVIIVGIYTYINIDIIGARGGSYTHTNVIFGGIFIFLIFEATRRAIGNVLLSVPIIFILYALFGRFLPGFLGHTGFNISRIIRHLYLTTEGIMGITTGVSASYVFLFVLFGAFLSKSGMINFLNQLALSLTGATRGGPAKVAVISSAMMGTISGSAASNVATTGTFTIPLMKKLGYPPNFSAGVEAAASTAGQITPPVMGAGAFLIAEFLGIPYLMVLSAAIVPALLYYVGIFSSVDIKARKLNLKGKRKSEIPNLYKLLKKDGHLLIPIIAIFYLLISGYTAIYAASRAIVVAIITSWLRKSTRLGYKGILDSLYLGAKTVLPVAIACIVVGNVVGIISLTGLGVRLGMELLSLAGGMIFPMLFFTMIVTIILGMGLPTSAAYIIAATTTAPALINAGMNPITSHLFVFYFAILAGITPPVAITAYIAAGISGGEPNRVAWQAMKLAFSGFIVPYMFISSPTLLLIEGTILSKLLAVCTALVGVMVASVATEGYFNKPLHIFERILCFIIGLLLINVGILTDLVGLVLLLVFILKNKEFIKSSKKFLNKRL